MAGTNFTEPLLHSRKSNSNYAYRAGFGMIPSAEWVVMHDDFLGTVTSNVPDGGFWEAAVIDIGATLTQLETDANPGGVIRLTSDGTTEGVALYAPKTIEIDAKKFMMECRVRTTDADDTDVQFGLSVVNATTNPEDLWTTTATDLIAFGVLDGDATVTMLCDINNGGAAANLGSIDLSDNTWHTLAIVTGGSSADSNMTVRGYVDGVEAIAWDVETEIPDDLVLSPFIGGRTGGDAAHNVDFDYVRFAFQR